jgi:hypothetical protein
MPAPPPVVMAPGADERRVVWGRWQTVMDKAPTLNFSVQKAISELIAVDGNFALFRSSGQDFVVPQQGTIGFALKDSEAYIYSDVGVFRSETAAQLNNGKLNIDFGNKQFTTSIDLISGEESFKLQAQGAVAGDGRLYGDPAMGRPGYIDVKGLLSKDQGGTAAYIFSGRLDSIRTVNGATFWR